MADKVGILHALKLIWLNRAMDLVSGGLDSDRIREELSEFLATEIESEIMQQKTCRMLMDIWVNPSPEMVRVRENALTAGGLSEKDSMAVHYSLLLIKYPIFADACGLIGKLSTIQDSFTTMWLRTRLYEVWGERGMIEAATRYILQTMVDIGVIKRLEKGVYEIVVMSVDSPVAILALMIAQLHVCKSYTEISMLAHLAHTFPFSFAVSPELLQGDSGFQISNFGGKKTVALSSS